MLRVVVSEPRPEPRQRLSALVATDRQIMIAGEAASPADALSLVRRLKPDLVILGVTDACHEHMTLMQEIMIEQPTPIAIIVTTRGDLHKELEDAVHAAGGVTVLVLPVAASPEREPEVQQFLTTLHAMAAVKVVRRWRPTAWGTPRGQARASTELARVLAQLQSRRELPAVVAVAASTGGPGALQTIFGRLPAHYPVPIVLVQHLSVGFTEHFAAWLGRVSSLRMCVAVDGEPLGGGKVFIAPDGYHLGVNSDRRIALSAAPPILGQRPSANFLFESVAQSFGARALGVILTGMGQDGARGLAELHRAGGKIIAQDERSAVVHSMPRAAIDGGLADLVMPTDDIAAYLLTLSSSNANNMKSAAPA